MKTESWLAAFAIIVACGKSAESKQDPAGTGELAGFYRVDSITAEGKDHNIEQTFKASFKGDAGQEVDLIRMTIEVTDGKLSVGNDQVFGGKGSASYCSVKASTDIVIANGTFTIPRVEAVTSTGRVSANGDNVNNNTSKCNVKLERGTYTIEARGAKIDLATTKDGKPFVLHLVADDKEIDLKARATALAKR